MTENEFSNSVATLTCGDVSEHTEEVRSAGFNRLWVTTRHGRRFLLKGLKQEYCGKPEFEALLRKEFELGMRLDHPSIVRVWGMEHFPGKGNCILMDYIDGEPLSKFMESHPGKAERIRIAWEVAESLVYIHAAGVWHRDLKPDNIMVTRSGRRIRLIDFGLGDSDDFVSFKGSGGTRAFGAPEQIREHRGDIRSDVYSFGRLMQYLHLPLRYADVWRKCLAEDPARRPTMESVLQSMGRIESWWRRIAIYVAVGCIVIAVAMVLLIPSKPEAVREEQRVQQVQQVQDSFISPADTNFCRIVSVPVPVDSVAACPVEVSAGKVATEVPVQKTTAQETAVSQAVADTFETDYEACLSRILDEGTPYIEQYVEARRQGREGDDVDKIRTQAYEIFSAHYIAFVTKWVQNGKSGEEVEVCGELLLKEVNTRWVELMKEVDPYLSE